MALFNSNPKKTLQQRSADAIDVFSKTVKDLTTINEEIDDDVAQKQAQIKELEEAANSLKQTSAKNLKVIGKINEIISDE